MQIAVLVEPVANSGFRAKAGEPLPLSADGATPDEAVRNLHERAPSLGRLKPATTGFPDETEFASRC